jgi:hypothetical protein
MSRKLILTALIGLAVALSAAAAASASLDVVRVGNLYLRGSGGIAPRKLPRYRQAPISASLHDEIGTTDGSHPPALTSVSADIDKTIQLNARGLPACSEGTLEARSTVEAKKACPKAIVGSGEAEVEVAFPEQAPFNANGPIVLFNGGVHRGTTVLYIHTYVAVPAPTAVIAKVQLSRISHGPFGLHFDAQIPPVAGGAGSAIKFRIRIGRKFTYEGRRASYLTASCPTGTYKAEATIHFAEAPTLKITHVLPCTPTIHEPRLRSQAAIQTGRR